METSSKYRKISENYSPFRVHYHKSLKHNHLHERFVVPWQMDDLTKEKEEEK